MGAQRSLQVQEFSNILKREVSTYLDPVSKSIVID